MFYGCCTNFNSKKFNFLFISTINFSSQAAVYIIDDLTGGLELSHTIELSAKDFPGSPGSVREMKWTPDGCAVMLSWSKGGISLWSTFGAMLMCSLGWDYGLNVDLALRNPLDITCMVSFIAIEFICFSTTTTTKRFIISLSCLMCRIGQRKVISCSCCVNRKSMMKMYRVVIHPVQIYQKMRAKWMANQHQHQPHRQYLINQLLCIHIPIYLIKVMRQPLNLHTHCKQH